MISQTSSVLRDAGNVTTGADVINGTSGPTTETSPVVISSTPSPDTTPHCE